MQELIDELKPHIRLEWPMNKWLTNTVNRALEKEKDHICNAYVEGLEGLYMGAEEYYNKRYNGKVPPCVGHELASQNEEEANRRMDIIGQNGNEGTHYDSDPEN